MASSTIDNIEDTTIMRMIRNLAKQIDDSGLNPEVVNQIKTNVDNLIFYVGKDVDLIPNYPFI